MRRPHVLTAPSGATRGAVVDRRLAAPVPAILPPAVPSRSADAGPSRRARWGAGVAALVVLLAMIGARAGGSDAVPSRPSVAPTAARTSGSSQTGPTRADPRAVARDLDRHWRATFAAAGFDYTSAAGLVEFEGAALSGCGWADEATEPAFYCGRDATIYVSGWFRRLIEEATGELAWGAVVAHEWGHHVQALLGIGTGLAPEIGLGRFGIEVELQADCLGGTYLRDVEGRGWIGTDDVVDATVLTAAIGDPAESAWYDPDAHGTGEQRVAAFTSGYTEGVEGCDLPALVPDA